MAQFQILHPYSQTEWRPVTTEFIWAPRDDQQYLWPSFEEAETARQQLLSRAPNAQFRIALAGTEIGDIDWQIREKLRFADGTYSPTPWHDEPWYQVRHGEHFCHISKAHAGKIAYTENAAKGQVDRQLVISPGRYLNRFFSEHLDNNAIEAWCARLSVLLEEHALKITQDADEIEDVYVGGPNSCMAHEADHFESPCHPVRVYAGPDTALAYIGSREDATARCVVWPDRRIYTNIYGDVSRLRLLLEGAGYRSGELNGARIGRIPKGDYFVVPYIDQGGDLRDDGAYLIVGHGSISSCSTTGLADIPWYCPRCDCDGEPHETVHIADGSAEEWCYGCFNDHATFCDHNQRHYSDNESFIIVYSDGGSHTVLEEDVEDFDAVYLEYRDEWWDSDCCRQCDASGEWFHRDDLTEYHGEWLSEEHLPEPFDDDEDGLPNAHILTYRQFHDEMAAIQAEVAQWQAAGARARDERFRREQDEIDQFRFAVLRHDHREPHVGVRSQGAQHEPTEISENLLTAIASAAPIQAANASHAGV
ncbi:hypothetical protein [Sphingobium sp. EM0848]|uniref:hypothetical protein n=1 Tax=Sphingobium sp. EM0848 TaxID=2743473 RepID=UPI00159C92A0|nr:hypothetical protein [Sphingobium sp. EM0848]